MSLAESISTPSQAARRFYARRKLDNLTYVEFGPENGAILIDLGEGGLGFQSVLPVSMNDTLLFKFKLPGENHYVEGFGEIAWMNESGKGGGLRFTEVADQSRAKIREWTGAPAAPESSGSNNGNNAEPPAATEKPNETANEQATSAILSAATEAAEAIDQPEEGGKASEEFSTRESSQPPSSLTDTDTGAIDPMSEAAASDQKTPTANGPQQPSIPEFTIEFVPPFDAPAAHVDSVLPAPGFAAHTLEHRPESVKQVNRPRMKGHKAEAPAPAPAPAAASAGFAVADAISAPAQMRRVPAPVKEPVKLEGKVTAAVPVANGETPYAQPLAAPPQTAPRQNALKADADGLQSQAAPASQVFRIALGVVAGACVVLLLFLILPSLRTRVEATAARPAVFNAPAGQSFEVEIADINNRRWILRSGGEAGSPFSEAPSRRESQSSASANSNRNESAKASRSEEADDSTNTDTKQSKLPKPAELALSRPRAAQAAPVLAQLAAPSIFDGITPPIGSVTDRLASGGPEAPGIVQPETQQQAIRTTALQSAVLVQRVAPVYPPSAMEGRVQGDIQVNATIGKDGVPKDLKVISGDLRLVPAALTAIRQWRYRPATLSGTPIETQIVVTVAFQLK
jgi:TonB family protein